LKEVVAPLEEGEEKPIVVNNIGLVYPKEDNNNILFYFLEKQ